MVDFSIQPAAHEDAKTDARVAAKWLIGSFAGVGAVLLAGVGISSFGNMSGVDLVFGCLAFSVGIGSVVAAVSVVGEVLTPEPLTLRDLAERQSKRNDGGPLDRDRLVEYLEGDPSFFQGLTLDTPEEFTLIVAGHIYEAALKERIRTAEAHWKAEVTNASSLERAAAQKAMEVANNRVEAIHYSVRRLERIAAAQHTVMQLRDRRHLLAFFAVTVAISIGVFAGLSGS